MSSTLRSNLLRISKHAGGRGCNDRQQRNATIHVTQALENLTRQTFSTKQRLPEKRSWGAIATSDAPHKLCALQAPKKTHKLIFVFILHNKLCSGRICEKAGGLGCNDHQRLAAQTLRASSPKKRNAHFFLYFRMCLDAAIKKRGFGHHDKAQGIGELANVYFHYSVCGCVS